MPILILIGIIIVIILCIVLAAIIGAIIAAVVAGGLYVFACIAIAWLATLAYDYLFKPTALASGKFCVFAWKSWVKPGSVALKNATSKAVIKPAKMKLKEMIKGNEAKPVLLMPKKSPDEFYIWKDDE